MKSNTKADSLSLESSSKQKGHEPLSEQGRRPPKTTASRVRMDSRGGYPSPPLPLSDTPVFPLPLSDTLLSSFPLPRTCISPSGTPFLPWHHSIPPPPPDILASPSHTNLPHNRLCTIPPSHPSIPPSPPPDYTGIPLHSPHQ